MEHSVSDGPLPEREFWLRSLAETESLDWPSRVTVHTNTGPTAGPGIHSRVSAPRLLICINRYAEYRLGGTTFEDGVSLAAGEALLLGSGVAIANISRRPYRSLGAIFYPDSLRLYEIEHTPAAGGAPPDPLRLQRHNYVHPVALGEDGRALLHCALRGGDPTPANAYLRHLVAALLCQIGICLRCGSAPETGKAARTFRNLVRHVEAHLAEPIARQDLAASLRLHPNHVSRLFRQYAGGTFCQFLRDTRLNRAEECLRAGRLGVAEIAYACGFGSASSFIRAFQGRHGVSPGRWAGANSAGSQQSPTTARPEAG